MNEFDLIARFFAPLSGDGSFGLTDDAAVITMPPGMELVVTTDAIAEGTDFFAFDPAGTVAQKALRVNLSDLAAKGAVPHRYLLNLSLPHSIDQGWLSAFAQGLKRDQDMFCISLLGGDTGATEGPLTIAVTAFGLLPQGAMVRRSGARTGDAVYVTGSIGEAGGGLAIFKREKHSLGDAERDQLTTRYRVPEPPVGFADSLRAIATASVDVSDGLLADLGHIAAASGVHIRIEGEAVPLSEPLRKLWGDNTLLRAVTAGDDYQIAFTAAPGLTGPFTRIGTVEAGAGALLTLGGQNVAVPSGYRHF